MDDLKKSSHVVAVNEPADSQVKTRRVMEARIEVLEGHLAKAKEGMHSQIEELERKLRSAMCISERLDKKLTEANCHSSALQIKLLKSECNSSLMESIMSVRNDRQEVEAMDAKLRGRPGLLPGQTYSKCSNEFAHEKRGNGTIIGI